MTVTEAPPEQAAPTAEKLRDVRTEAKTGLVGMEETTNLAFLCIFAKVHPILIGLPGVAKSMTVERIVKHIDPCEYFHILFAKDTLSEEVLGQLSLTALERDIFQRVIEGRLPVANLAFFDEGFKANSTVLNAMLRILNERKFRNNGADLDVPLWSSIIASNELPGLDRDDLRAFRDRFGALHEVEMVRTDSGRKDILRGQIERNAEPTNYEPQHTLTAEEVEATQHDVTQVDVEEPILEHMTDVWRKWETEHGGTVSPRRMGEGLKLMQSQAVINGRTRVVEDDLSLLRFVLPNDLEDIKAARDLTAQYAGAVSKAAQKFRKEVAEEAKKLNELAPRMSQDTFDKELVGELTPVAAQLKNIDGRLDKEHAQLTRDGRDTSELDEVKREVTESRKVVREFLGMGDL